MILIARVTPGNAAGTVEFKDGDTNIGNPVPVFGGFALRLTFGLEQGPHELTAVFTPANSAAFAGSTSDPVPVTVTSLFGGLFGGLFGFVQ